MAAVRGVSDPPVFFPFQVSRFCPIAAACVRSILRRALLAPTIAVCKLPDSRTPGYSFVTMLGIAFSPVTIDCSRSAAVCRAGALDHLIQPMCVCVCVCVCVRCVLCVLCATEEFTRFGLVYVLTQRIHHLILQLVDDSEVECR